MSSISDVKEKLKNQHMKYIESMYHLRTPRLIKERKKLMEKGGVSTEAWIEATPHYVTGKKFNRLNLPSDVVDILKSLENVGLDIYDPPYQHQADALESFFSANQDLIVSTGTGSGKTEIFLYSILGKIAKEANRGKTTNQRGIRFLILYPMNALVADQLARMRLMFGDEKGAKEIEKFFGRKIQFGMYTSRTPYHGKYDQDRNDRQLKPIIDHYLNLKNNNPDLFQKLKSKGRIPTKDLDGFRNRNKPKKSQYRTQPGDTELFTRQEMHTPNEYGGTPDILITNYSMLEYMLLRPIEQPLFQDTREWLKQDDDNELLLVLDEAHLYRGAQGAEVSLLIRRLLQHLDITQSRVRFILTSATFGGDVKKIGPKFAAQLTPSKESDFDVITGIKETFEGGNTGNEDIAQILKKINYQFEKKKIENLAKERGWEGINENDQKNFNLKLYLGEQLQKDSLFRLAHDKLSEETKPLTELANDLFPSVKDSIAEEATGNLLYLATEAKRNREESLLPSRLHIFLKGLPKLYTCINPECEGRRAKDSQNPLLGRFYTSPKIICPKCGNRVFELLSHRTCGASYIKAFRKKGSKEPYFLWSNAENISGMEELHILMEQPRGDKHPQDDIPLSQSTISRYLDISTGHLVRSIPEGEENRFIKVWIPGQEQKPKEPDWPWSWVRCPACGIDEKKRKPGGETYIMDLETKGEEIFANIIREMFHFQPKDRQKKHLPNKGKKVLTFSDGRQKAARLARDLQRNVELDSFREVIADIIKDLPDDSSMDKLFPAFAIYCKQKKIAFFDDEDRVAYQDGIEYRGSRTKLEKIQERLDEIRDQYNLKSIDNILKNEYAIEELTGRDRPRKYNSTLLKLLGDSNFSIWAALVGYLRPTKKVMEILNKTNIKIDSDLLEEVIIEILRYACKERAFDADISNWDRKESRSYSYSRSGGEGLSNNELVPSYIRNKISDNIDEAQLKELKQSLYNPEERPRLFEPLENGKYVINPSAVTLELAVEDKWYRCKGCNRFIIKPINEICPYEGCRGEVEKLDLSELHLQAKKGFLRDPVLDVVKENREPFTLRSEEHSAQLTAKDYKEPFSKTELYELLFQDILIGDEQPIDVLSCTTTMEVGIDIGSLTGVAMRTVPPRPENYEQRSGRAGRRGVGLSTIVTFADNTPHESYYFDNPDLMIEEEASDPIIYSENEKIAERHINASLIARFFDPSEIKSSADVFESLGKSEDFFEKEGQYSLSSFKKWTKNNVLVKSSKIAQELGELLPRELGKNKDKDWSKKFVKNTAKKLLNELEKLKNRTDWSKGRDPNEKLLNALLDDALLPTFSFPIDVCDFVIKEIDRETNLPTTKYEMSRDIKQALSTYIPGRQIVVDKKTYTSYGVYFPFADNPVNRASGVKWDELDWLNFCPLCESVYEDKENNLSKKEIKCQTCDEELESIPMFEPPAFAPEIKPDKGPEEGKKWEEERIYSTPAKFPIPPSPSFEDESVETKEIGLSIVRKLSNQNLIVANLGPDEEGFEICTSCGAVSREGELGSNHNRPYPRDNLRVDEDWPKRCSGSTIRSTFGHEFPSDLTTLKVPIKTPFRFAPNSPSFNSAAKTLSEALVLGASRALDIESSELKGGYRTLARHPSDDQEIRGYIEFFLFDTTPGGAGFAAKVWDNFRTVLETAMTILSECNCNSSCHSCLQTYHNRHLHDDLNRFLGKTLLYYAERGCLPEISEEKRSRLFKQLSQTINLKDSSINFEKKSNDIWVIKKNENKLNISIRSPLRENRVSSSKDIDKDIDTYSIKNRLPEVTEKLINSLIW